MIIEIVGLFWFGRLRWFAETDVSNAQISDIEYQKLFERDKNVPKEKVDKAFVEAKKIQDNVIRNHLIRKYPRSNTKVSRRNRNKVAIFNKRKINH